MPTGSSPAAGSRPETRGRAPAEQRRAPGSLPRPHLKQPPPVVIRTRRPIDPRTKSAGRSRLQRWDDATNVLLGIQVECVDWLMALPDSLRGTAMAEALEAIADLDLSALAEIKPPRGYGRD